MVYFEAKPDRQTLNDVLVRCGKSTLVQRARPDLLKGFGDIENVGGACRILKSLLPMKVAVVVIRDADYTELNPNGSCDDKGDYLVITLPCKELENLLLLKPTTIANAARKAAEIRQANTGEACSSPNEGEVEQKIADFTQLPDIRKAIKDQWLYRWLELKGGLRDAGDISIGKREFEKCWNDVNWRRRCCPGKLVLTHIRRWLQSDPWKLSIMLPKFFEYYEPDSEVQELFNQMENFVGAATK